MEIVMPSLLAYFVMPREGHGSRNRNPQPYTYLAQQVMPREGHGSRNYNLPGSIIYGTVSCPARGMGVEIHILVF